jgi:hypothetical protein
VFLKVSFIKEVGLHEILFKIKKDKRNKEMTLKNNGLTFQINLNRLRWFSVNALEMILFKLTCFKKEKVLRV